MSGYGGHPVRRSSGSTAVEVGLHAYPLNPIPHHHHDPSAYDPYNDDRASIRTAVASSSEEEAFYKSKAKGSPVRDDVEAADPRRDVPSGRTPSPTPSELKELKTGAIDWAGLRSWRFWFRREWLWYYVALVIIIVITALVSVYHRQIVRALEPAARWLHDTRGGFMVPIAVLFVISFPPLFGHEIVAILCGLVWGLWIGFAIVAVGTLLGEIGNFYAFKYCCRARGAKMERTNISYACLAKVVRDGGFRIALIARLSAIPGHFTTAIFSTCGMGIIVFTLATILSMPKQVIGVYLGVVLEQSEAGTGSRQERIVTNVVLALTILITAVAMWYILRQMNKVKPQIIYKRRKARQAKLSRASSSPSSSNHPYLSAGSGNGHRVMGSESTIVFNPNDDNHNPLNSKLDSATIPLKQIDPASSQTTLFPPTMPSPMPMPIEAPQPRRPVVSLSPGSFVISSRSASISPGSPPAGTGALNSPSSARSPPYGAYYSSSRGPQVPLGEEGMDEVGWDTGSGRDRVQGAPLLNASSMGGGRR